MALISLNNLERFFNNLKTYISNALSSKANASHTHSASDITSGLATIATSGSYADLSNKPTIPTVNNATLTIQKNGTTVKTFTANASSNVTANITVPTKTSDLTNDSGFLTSHQDLSGYVPRSGGAVMTGNTLARTVNNNLATYCGGNSSDNGAFVRVHGKDYTDSPYAGTVLIRAQNNSDYFDLFLKPDGTALWGNKNLAMQEDVVPRSGGVLGSTCRYTCNTTSSYVYIYSGTDWYNGAGIALNGGTFSNEPGVIDLQACIGIDNRKKMQIRPNGTWTWDGTACQITSDQRLKQQIAEIDDKLLDAWEDVNLVQFKYNDAVDQKKDKARLHTGYVVQQIDNACKSHGVDISEYGLYCHEEYPERTEEVTIENEDGTTTKETKVIEKASEHYSLRYTEALIVECAYLRKCIKELKEEIKELKNK